MIRVKADVLNSFYRIPTPTNAPLRGGLDIYWRYKTRPICARCDRQFPKDMPLVIQIPKFREQTVGGKVLRIPEALPGVHDEKIMEQFMVLACNKGVGCWRECRCGKNYNMTCINNCVIRGVPFARKGDCPCICACNPGCGNRKKYPCECGYVKLFHNSGCPVGEFKRDSSFLIALVRRRMMDAARRQNRS